MQVTPLLLAGLQLIEVTWHGDERGRFAEVFNQERFAEAGLPTAFVQDNQSWSREAGTLRGLHWQYPPFAQTKLLRVVRGAVLDVAIDLRRGSPTHGRHVMVELSAGDRRQLLVPKGFAHGFLTLEPETEVIYKVDAPYAADAEGGIRFDDPDLGIVWPASPGVRLVSPRDRALPYWRELAAPFAD